MSTVRLSAAAGFTAHLEAVEEELCCAPDSQAVTSGHQHTHGNQSIKAPAPAAPKFNTNHQQPLVSMLPLCNHGNIWFPRMQHELHLA
jgi:hypothetical protein